MIFFFASMCGTGCSRGRLIALITRFTCATFVVHRSTQVLYSGINRDVANVVPLYC